MKKLATVLATVLMMAILATPSFAAPGGSREHRHNDYRKPHRIQPYKYDQRHHISYRVPQKQHIVVRHLTRPEPQRIVYVTHPPLPGFTMFFPSVTIQIR
ncbi:MAG: hypothetical protein R6W75_10050 [Smithellaceae bacterium]